MNKEENKIEFDAQIIQNGTMDAGYVEVPVDRLLVHATFDNVKYDGQVVKMGLPCYIIGVNKEVRKKLNKSFGDTIHVILVERQ